MRPFLLLLLAIAGIAFCPDAGLAYRPFFTEDAGVAGKGAVELEVGWEHVRWKNDDSDNIFVAVPKYGLTERLELALEIPYLFRHPTEGDDENGLGDIIVGAKFNLLEEKGPWPAFTLKGVLKTPSGNEKKGLGTGYTDYGLIAIATKGFGPLTLHSMLGYAVVGSGAGQDMRNIHVYGLAADYRLTDKFHLVGEISGTSHPNRSVEGELVGFLFGTRYEISDNIILDAAVRHGMHRELPGLTAIAGISTKF